MLNNNLEYPQKQIIDPHHERGGKSNLTAAANSILAESKKSLYWDIFYSESDLKSQPPSQFAAFVASECSSFPLILDIGCGSGRDTVFFANLGFATIAIDGSKSAVRQTIQRFSKYAIGSDIHEFHCINAADLPEADDLIYRISQTPKVIYSRFFLHAITDAEQASFFNFSYKCLSSDDVLALEYRTTEDSHRQKVTNPHYRRYIDTQELIDNIQEKKEFRIEYCLSGTGLAKYKNDDAHVTRLLLRRE